jgi:uncharacterized protein YktB (UPF0637 family)
MAAPAFSAADFKVFDADGFQPRMDGIRERIRPKLEAIGQRLAPALGQSLGSETFAHVARHARRTVNPPDDTWVAFGPDPRGYKKHCHFKVAISRRCVRFLFEIGPEHGEKAQWASAWRKNIAKLGPVLRRVKGLAWFGNEHDEEPAVSLADLEPEALVALGEVLVKRRDGQVVLGRAVPAGEAARWPEAQYRAVALETFRCLAPLYRLR